MYIKQLVKIWHQKFAYLIYIDSDQESILKQVAKDKGISEAEIIRQAIDQHSQSIQYHQPDLSAWEKEKAFIQQLISQSPEQGSVSSKRTWRREDLYER